MIVTILSVLFKSKWSTFNKRIVSGKNFKATSSVVYAVGIYMTKDFEGFLNQVRTWFLRIASVRECLYPCVCVCVCVCPQGY